MTADNQANALGAAAVPAGGDDPSAAVGAASQLAPEAAGLGLAGQSMDAVALVGPSSELTFGDPGAAPVIPAFPTAVGGAEAVVMAPDSRPLAGVAGSALVGQSAVGAHETAALAAQPAVDGVEAVPASPAAADPASQVFDPATPALVLAQLAYDHPELRLAVPGHPAAYPGLLDWLDALGDSAVSAAVAARRARDATPPPPPPPPVPAAAALDPAGPAAAPTAVSPLPPDSASAPLSQSPAGAAGAEPPDRSASVEVVLAQAGGKRCGRCKAILNGAQICPQCGVANRGVLAVVGRGSTTVAAVAPRMTWPGDPPSQYRSDAQTRVVYVRRPANPADTDSVGWAVLGFFVPLVGLILWLVWQRDRPNNSRRARNGFIAGTIVQVAIPLLISIIYFFALMASI
ncbi:MAG: PLD nuclease N-terminal domain-containing protein [Propionibacteriaceae bacterium]|jgi:hypothetical protein|nr:PLD nuclease N-terminal domain-containing protein [Propionibacteriaceae bacterium]